MTSEGMNKKRGTFLLKIASERNATWQGDIVWVDRQREQHFNSALELMKLIENALEERK